MSAVESTDGGSPEPPTAPRSSGGQVRALPGGVAAVAVGALLWIVSGITGVAGGGVLFVAWAVLPATYAFAIGQVVLVAVTRSAGLLDVGLLPLALVEFGLAGVLLGPGLRSADDRRTAAATLLGWGLLAGVALASNALWGRLWVAATVLVGLGGLVAYGIHRYELVVLGKVAEPESETGVATEAAGSDSGADTGTTPSSDPDTDGDSDTGANSDIDDDSRTDDGHGIDPEGDGSELRRERDRTGGEPGSADLEGRDGPDGGEPS